MAQHLIESFSLEKTFKIIEFNYQLSIDMFMMSLSATSTFLLNTSGNGDSTTSLDSSEQYCSSAWQPLQWRNVS